MSAKVVFSKVLGKGFGTLTEYIFRYRRFDGTEGEICREVYDRGHAAAVLLHNPATDKVILVRQFRPPAMLNGDNPYMLEAVAGLLDGDDPEACARREALEEAGVVVKNLELVSASYGLCAFVTEVLTMFIGTYDDHDRQRGGGLAHEGEDIEVLELSFKEAYGMIASGEIMDMKTVVLLQALMLRRGTA
ncbi:NUDIX domain-containing protein [Rhizobium grahamii]|uniref:GDP-mannose pyrophosphatase n=1 Tax=Rhizobium grahamii CCGE 502 TaxID=990285 RepID=S3HFS7_9HYPH|nr:NUDIX domain-containing protein [Rhizobium grahamii]EPE96930.1 GDP-mannose pyrophosphatase nudK [Rhizobium grahamii CCGE 502]